MEKTKKIAIVLGAMILAFGLLKFIDPFKTWYATQIESSGLPEMAYPLGVAVEIATGLLLLIPFVLITGINQRKWLLILGHLVLIATMAVATYVHMIPEVPADVLPMKIKPPVIPLSVLVAALVNLVYLLRRSPRGSFK